MPASIHPQTDLHSKSHIILHFGLFLFFWGPYCVISGSIAISFKGNEIPWQCLFFKLKLNYVKVGLKWKARTYEFIFEKIAAREAIVIN